LPPLRLVNEKLERGVALADAPGLHDPSEAMRKITDVALEAAHAVVYVVDVSPARNWGFSLSEQTIADLKRLRRKAERLFLVLNKADDIPADHRDPVRAYVERELDKYGIWNDLPAPPIFLSARTAWEWDRSGPSPIAELEEALWTHLLQSQSTGVDRLTGSILELTRAARDLAALLAIRKVNAAKAAQLQTSLTACRQRREQLLAECRRQKRLESRRLATVIDERCTAVRRAIEESLATVPLNQPLPPVEKLRENLHGHVLGILQLAWNGASRRAQAFAEHIAAEVERCLQQARAAFGSVAGAEVRFVMPALQGMESLGGDSLSEAWTGLVAGGLFGLLIQSPLFWAIAIGGWFAGLILGTESRRKRDISRIMAKVDTALRSAVTSVHAQVFEKVSVHLGYLESHVLDRIVLFIKDADRQMTSLTLAPAADGGGRLDGWQGKATEAVRAIVSVARELDPALIARIEGDDT
jgi:hypothetical protein